MQENAQKQEKILFITWIPKFLWPSWAEQSILYTPKSVRVCSMPVTDGQTVRIKSGFYYPS